MLRLFLRKLLAVFICLSLLASSWLPYWQIEQPPWQVKTAQAIDCGFGTDIGGGVCRGFLTTTGSLLTWTSPADWNNDDNYIEVIGAGGSGGAVRGSTNNATGGGGGAYARIDNFEITTPGTTTASYRVGSGGTEVTVNTNTSTAGNTGSDTWFNSASFPGAGTDNTKIGAKGGGGGSAGSSTQSGGAGGIGTNGWGETRRSGGNGGSTGAHTNVATGGGGSAGNSSTGGSGVNSSGNGAATNGGQANGSGASGGSGSSGNAGQTGGPGENGAEWQTSPATGSGGGGGGARSVNNNQTSRGGQGGSYGGGGGGAVRTATNGTSIGGHGADGSIVITYTPVAAPTISISITTDGIISYGTIAPGGSTSTVTLSDTQTLRNDSSVAIDVNIKTSQPSGWTLGSSAGSDIFVHEFSTNGGSGWTQFSTADSYQTLTTSLAADATQNFDLQLTAPNPSTSGTEKSITITVQAVES
jgi:hypothetical protein